MAEVEKELDEIERRMSDLEKDREDRSKRIMDRRVLQVTTLQELGKTGIFCNELNSSAHGVAQGTFDLDSPSQYTFYTSLYTKLARTFFDVSNKI